MARGKRIEIEVDGAGKAGTIRIGRGCRSSGTASMPRSSSAVSLAIALSLAAVAASAGDGVLEINQVCAVQTGCFPGDTAGFPVSIEGPSRSHRLTSNLVVPDQDTDAILVKVSGVSIDLNGFAIVRAACVGATSSCISASGTGSGVFSSSSIRGTSVRNGSIVGMGRHGVILGEQIEVVDLNVRWNRMHGISTGSIARVSNCMAHENGANGINGTSGLTIVDSVSRGNLADGIAVTSDSTIVGNVVESNGRDGIYDGGGSTISGNTAFFNDRDGIRSEQRSLIENNAVYSNDGAGLSLGDGVGFVVNVIQNNAGGTVGELGIYVNLGHNACNASASCP